MALPDNVKNAGTVATTIAVFVLVGAWSLVVFRTWGNSRSTTTTAPSVLMSSSEPRTSSRWSSPWPPSQSATGSGLKGKAKSDEKAKDAEVAKDQAETAKNEAVAGAQEVNAQNAALVQAARETDPAIRERAREPTAGSSNKELSWRASRSVLNTGRI